MSIPIIADVASNLYSPKYICGSQDDPRLIDICEKLYKRLFPWRISRLILGTRATRNTLFHIIVSKNLLIVLEKNRNNLYKIYFKTGNNFSSVLPGEYTTELNETDIDYIIEEIVTYLHIFEPGYLDFIQRQLAVQERQRLLSLIDVEINYHPDAPLVNEIIKDHFNELQK